MLTDLAERFARFRRDNPRGTRVPGDLRAAALAVLKMGIAPGALHRACGVSWSQVIAWRAAERPVAATARRTDEPGDAADVHVFSVVDEPLVREEERATTRGHVLELRLGPWSVSVRLAEADAGAAGRG